MTSVNIGVCVLIFISLGCSIAELTCGPNESVDNCPRNCSYDYCPKNEHQDKIPCPKPTTCPPPACKCNFNFRRAENKTCIPTEMCEPFTCHDPNEIFYPCPPYCPGNDCHDANPTGECPFPMLLVVNCSPSCRCKPRYWRDGDVCVPYRKCPGVEEELEKNGNKMPDFSNFFYFK